MPVGEVVLIQDRVSGTKESSTVCKSLLVVVGRRLLFDGITRDGWVQRSPMIIANSQEQGFAARGDRTENKQPLISHFANMI